MCGSEDNKETDWQKEPPDSPGEWLWVYQFGCGCVLDAGIAWVPEKGYEPEGLLELPCGLFMSWERNPDKCQKLEWITAWRKINLPPEEMYDI